MASSLLLSLSVASRCGSLLLSLSADVRSSDDVIAFEGRRSTEVLSSSVNAAIIFGGGLARAVGSAVLTMLPKAKEAWMPLIAAGYV